ncbi:MAG: hypothetical protein CMO80_24595 [Verrucomicrobiales bacterium]|nr:hypothetical protein [Verrucomicrobiales bacterium]|tara:strand:- start:329 stop:535 length:207 start_codon:yes stop_codon:yes gene_type:complete
MSLKAIHIVLIISSILLAFGFGAFELHRYQSGREMVDLVLGAGSSVAGLALLIYGFFFLKKTRHISYL